MLQTKIEGLKLEVTVRFVPKFYAKHSGDYVRPHYIARVTKGLPQDLSQTQSGFYDEINNNAMYWSWEVFGDTETEALTHMKELLQKRNLSGTMKINQIGYQKGDGGRKY